MFDARILLSTVVSPSKSVPDLSCEITRSVIRRSGSQIRGSGSEIRWDPPQFNPWTAVCSTITTWTREGELEAYRNMLTQFPDSVVSVVSDSYDVFNACETLFGDELHDLVVQRGSSSRLVIRPDSGDPKTVVVKVCCCLRLFSI